MKNKFKQTLFLLFTLFLTACISENEEKQASGNIQVNDLLPAFSVQLNNGKTITNHSLEGKVSFIMLMTVTCPDCMKQFPAVEKLYNDYKENEDVVIIAISRAQGESIVSSYWEKQKFQMPYSAQENRDIYNLFAKMTIPRIYISDPSGKVRYMYTDKPIARYEELKNNMELLMNE